MSFYWLRLLWGHQVNASCDHFGLACRRHQIFCFPRSCITSDLSSSLLEKLIHFCPKGTQLTGWWARRWPDVSPHTLAALFLDGGWLMFQKMAKQVLSFGFQTIDSSVFRNSSNPSGRFWLCHLDNLKSGLELPPQAPTHFYLGLCPPVRNVDGAFLLGTGAEWMGKQNQGNLSMVALKLCCSEAVRIDHLQASLLRAI